MARAAKRPRVPPTRVASRLHLAAAAAAAQQQQQQQQPSPQHQQPQPQSLSQQQQQEAPPRSPSQTPARSGSGALLPRASLGTAGAGASLGADSAEVRNEAHVLASEKWARVGAVHAAQLEELYLARRAAASDMQEAAAAEQAVQGAVRVVPQGVIVQAAVPEAVRAVSGQGARSAAALEGEGAAGVAAGVSCLGVGLAGAGAFAGNQGHVGTSAQQAACAPMDVDSEGVGAGDRAGGRAQTPVPAPGSAAQGPVGSSHAVAAAGAPGGGAAAGGAPLRPTLSQPQPPSAVAAAGAVAVAVPGGHATTSARGGHQAGAGAVTGVASQRQAPALPSHLTAFSDDLSHFVRHERFEVLASLRWVVGRFGGWLVDGSVGLLAVGCFIGWMGGGKELWHPR